MIDKRNMTSQKVDLVFARHKDKKARHVTYPQFVECLEEISSIRYPGLEEYRTFSGQSAQLLKLFRSTIFPCRWAVRVRALLFRVLARLNLCLTWGLCRNCNSRPVSPTMRSRS